MGFFMNYIQHTFTTDFNLTMVPAKQYWLPLQTLSGEMYPDSCYLLDIIQNSTHDVWWDQVSKSWCCFYRRVVGVFKAIIISDPTLVILCKFGVEFGSLITNVRGNIIRIDNIHLFLLKDNIKEKLATSLWQLNKNGWIILKLFLKV